MLNDLSDSYYLDNVITLFEHVESVYGDILEDDLLLFLQTFSKLSVDASKLYVRVLNRSGEYFRVAKLNYTEIASISDAIAELADNEFLQIDFDINPPELISLFTKSELLDVIPDSKPYRKLKRSELEAFIFDPLNQVDLEQLRRSTPLIHVLKKDYYLICQMLFFGNLNQSMTDFVLRDLGLNTYESYSFTAENRPYRSTTDIQLHWMLQKIQSLLALCDANDVDTWLDCFNAIEKVDDDSLPLFRRSERLKYHISRQIERLGKLTLALSLYQQCQLPPSRERICRLKHQLGDSKAALELCETIIQSPYDDAERQFACLFGQRLIKRNGFAASDLISRHNIEHQAPVINLELTQQPGVEQAVVDYYLSDDPQNHCYFLENSLFNAVLGLLIWDAVFTATPGAFYNPFQYRPADFYAHDFVSKRSSQFDRIWSSIHNNEDIWLQVKNCWENKSGISNPLVNWQAISLEIIQLALQRIDFDHWMAIFKRIMLNLRQNSAGFPDLVLFPPDAGYQLIEVKGPGDSLQKNQQRWMEYFSEHEIPHVVAKVTWSPRS